jgi:hypothetical protein
MKPHGTFVQGDVVSLSDSEATLSDGRVLAFDWAAIATGSSYAVGKATEGAVTTEGRRAEVEVSVCVLSMRARVCGAHSLSHNTWVGPSGACGVRALMQSASLLLLRHRRWQPQWRRRRRCSSWAAAPWVWSWLARSVRCALLVRACAC